MNVQEASSQIGFTEYHEGIKANSRLNLHFGEIDVSPIKNT